MFLRGTLELRQVLLRDVEHHLVIGDEKDLVPGNRERGMTVGPSNHNLCDFGKLAGLDNGEITQAPDAVPFHKHSSAEDLAQEELMLTTALSLRYD